MMTPEAVQRYFDIKDRAEGMAKLIKQKIFGDKGYLLGCGFLHEKHDKKRVLIFTVYGLGAGGDEEIEVPAKALYDAEALEAFLAEYEPKAAKARREKFEELRKEFCEQPCVDH